MVGIDDRLVDSNSDGISNAAAFVMHLGPQLMDPPPAGWIGIRLVSSAEVLVAATVPDGMEAQLRFSDDGSNWYSMESVISPVFRDVVAPADISEMNRHRLFRWEFFGE